MEENNEEELKEVLNDLKNNEENENNNINSKKNTKKNTFIVLLIILVGILLFIFYICYEKHNCNDIYNPTRTNQNSNPSIDDKPIIYLYPTEDTNVSVSLGYPENITVSYPKYTDGWNVFAKTDSSLVDLDTGKNLYSLYYESTNNIDFNVTDEGFVVKGNDVTEFLEDKLAILGLTEREAEEFIIYWLPKLQENDYNYIRFATYDEIEKNMPLTIIPTPDNTIRVLMIFKKLNAPIEVKEQVLTTPERTGFVAVEWGGTEIK